MGLQNKGAKYQSVSLDKKFIKAIQEHIKDKPYYRSVADYIRFATLKLYNEENLEVR